MDKEQTEVPPTKPAAQSCSVAGAQECLEQMIALLPKTKRLAAIGLANEITVVIENLWGYATAPLDVETVKKARLEPVSKTLLDLTAYDMGLTAR